MNVRPYRAEGISTERRESFSPYRRRGIYFLLFCVDKRGESNKEEKNNQRGDFDFPPLDTPLKRPEGVATPIWTPPGERPQGNIP